MKTTNDITELTKTAKAMSDKNRVKALLALKIRGELCLCELMEILELSASTVSKHMSILFDAGLINRRKEKTWCYFNIENCKSQSALTKKALKWIFSSIETEKCLSLNAKSNLQACQ